MTTLADLPLHTSATIAEVDGERPFRRRLLEMGLLPGTQVAVVNVAPLGDPLEIELRDGRMSIRRVEAARVRVQR
jgi:Fe2+ transport system protein FeoA